MDMGGTLILGNFHISPNQMRVYWFIAGKIIVRLKWLQKTIVVELISELVEVKIP